MKTPPQNGWIGPSTQASLLGQSLSMQHWSWPGPPPPAQVSGGVGGSWQVRKPPSVTSMQGWPKQSVSLRQSP
jgi:hypothetical protein